MPRETGQPVPDLGLRHALADLRIELAILNDKVAAVTGLSPRDLDVLDVVAHDGPCSPGQLIHRTGIRAATLTGVLARLERDGWVTRTSDRRDGRSARIAAAARVERLHELYRSANGALADVSARFSDDERAVIARFLSQVAAGARSISATMTPTRQGADHARRT